MSGQPAGQKGDKKMGKSNIITDRGIIESLSIVFPPGSRIKLLSMRGEPSMDWGSTGTVVRIDDAGQIHVKWDNGRNLAVIPGLDHFSLI